MGEREEDEDGPGRSGTGSGRERDGKRVVLAPCRVVLRISTDEYRYCQILPD
jgi:hypothetical protein